MLIVLVIAAIAITLYYWLARPRLRLLPWWDDAVAEVRAVMPDPRIANLVQAGKMAGSW